MFTHLVDLAQGKAPIGTRRSSRWPMVRSAWLALNPTCAVCGGKSKLEVHHKEPFHLRPELELAFSNLMTLCESRRFINCHLMVGHLGNYRSFNPDAVSHAALLNHALVSRPAPEYTP